MSQTLTQPEEIDNIWRAMAWHDFEIGAPVQEGVQPVWVDDFVGSAQGSSHDDPNDFL